MSNTASSLATVDEARREPRTHLFVAATLYSDAGSGPVNIRNMSPTGALIDSPNIPEPGEAVVLRRGRLEIAGRIAWKAGRKAGVAFCFTVHVAEWMSRMPSAGQHCVDRVVSDFKAGRPSVDPISESVPLGNSMAAELAALGTELRALESSLVSDAILVATHPEIQTLDISLQRIDRMIGQLGNEA